MQRFIDVVIKLSLFVGYYFIAARTPLSLREDIDKQIVYLRQHCLPVRQPVQRVYDVIDRVIRGGQEYHIERELDRIYRFLFPNLAELLFSVYMLGAHGRMAVLQVLPQFYTLVYSPANSRKRMCEDFQNLVVRLGPAGSAYVEPLTMPGAFVGFGLI